MCVGRRYRGERVGAVWSSSNGYCVLPGLIAVYVHRIRSWVRNILYPGLDLHTRNRASLCRFWKTGQRDVLDAGSGNGYFSWLAYRSGARVVALNFEKEQVEKASEFLLAYKGADPARLTFEQRHLYDRSTYQRPCGDIILYETMVH